MRVALAQGRSNSEISNAVVAYDVVSASTRLNLGYPSKEDNMTTHYLG